MLRRRTLYEAEYGDYHDDDPVILTDERGHPRRVFLDPHHYDSSPFPWYMPLLTLGTLTALGLAIGAMFLPVQEEFVIPDPLQLDTLIVDNITCPALSVGLDETCLPSDVSFDNVNITETLVVNDIQCSGDPLPQSCIPEELFVTNITLSNSMQCALKGGVDEMCIPDSLMLQDLVVYNLTVINSTVVDSKNLTELRVDMLFSNETTIQGPFTCVGAGMDTINSDCLDISGDGPCSTPIDDSCIPERVATINGEGPDGGTLDFQVLAGDNVNITTNANGSIVIEAQIGATPLQTFYFDDMISRDTVTSSGGAFHGDHFQWKVALSGNNAAVSATSVGVNPTDRAIGVCEIDTGNASTNGRYVAISVSTLSILFGYSTFFTEWRVRAPAALPTAMDNYVWYVGFIDNVDASCVGGVTMCQPIDGVFFKIDRSISTTNWVLIARNNNVQTAIDSGIAISTTSFVVLRIDVNEDGTLVEGFINGVSTGTIATNIPTVDGRQTGFGSKIVIDGSMALNRAVYVDYVDICYQFSGDR